MGFNRSTYDVFIQDQTTPFINWCLSQKLSTATFASNVTRGVYSFDVVAGHSIVIGNCLEIFENNIPYQVKVMNVVSNTITIEKPIIINYTTSAIINVVNTRMNVDGSVTPIEFNFNLPTTLEYDIYMVSGMMLCATSPDDSKFGDLATLTNGVLIGKVNSNLQYDAYPYNINMNGEFSLNSFDVIYTDKGGGGNYSTNIKKHINQTTGVAVRIKPNQKIVVIVRDDLTDLVEFKTMLIGHIVE